VRAPGAITAPYFFLSYAHKSRGDVREEGESDYWVSEFFRDLCRVVERRAGLLRGASPGFMDRDRRADDDWPTGLVRALATCRVFVPLYSSRYFADEYCGKEWQYFARRTLDPAASEAAIVPGIWEPVGRGKLPQVARVLQLRHRGSHAYETLGLYGIMKLSRYRKEYEQTLSDLADLMVTAAERHPVKEGPAVDYRVLEGAFGHDDAAAQGKHADKRVRITVVAPRRDELPRERENSSSYGPSALDWKPYTPDSARPIIDVAAELARSLGYQAEVGDLYRHERDLLSGDSRSGPQILIIDPWALLVPHSQQLLEVLGRRQMPWVQAVIAWNTADEDSQRAEVKLRGTLEATLQRKLVEVASISVLAAQGVPSLDDFDVVLRQLIGAAAKKYLDHAAAFPPVGKVIERPRIS
jgi:FxsC-like protein